MSLLCCKATSLCILSLQTFPIGDKATSDNGWKHTLSPLFLVTKKPFIPTGTRRTEYKPFDGAESSLILSTDSNYVTLPLLLLPALQRTSGGRVVPLPMALPQHPMGLSLLQPRCRGLPSPQGPHRRDPPQLPPPLHKVPSVLALPLLRAPHDRNLPEGIALEVGGG